MSMWNKGDLSDFNVACSWVLMYLSILETADLVAFTERSLKKRKYPVSSGSLTKNAVLMPE